MSLRFFFSSRRRHTRWPRDWSSDVCSSDLLRARGFSAAPINGDIPQNLRERTIEALKDGRTDILVATDVAARRSEERRVGKGGGGWWATECLRVARWPVQEGTTVGARSAG